VIPNLKKDLKILINVGFLIIELGMFYIKNT